MISPGGVISLNVNKEHSGVNNRRCREDRM